MSYRILVIAVLVITLTVGALSGVATLPQTVHGNNNFAEYRDESTDGHPGLEYPRLLADHEDSHSG